MKRTGLLCLLLFASLTWGQSGGTSVLNGQPQPLQMSSNPQHANAAPMSTQQNLLGSNAYSSSKGERPLWEVAPPPRPTVPLADTARALRKQHELAKKAVYIREN